MYVYLFSAEDPDQDIELYDSINDLMVDDNLENGGEGILGIEDVFLVDENVIAVLTSQKDFDLEDIDYINYSKHDVEITISKKNRDNWDSIVVDYVSKYLK